MRIEHVALWTPTEASLARLCEFYARWFGAVAGERYASARRPGFVSRFLTFGDGARLELMTVPGLGTHADDERAGWAHVAIALGSRAAVDALAARMRTAGVPVDSGPRVTGDGYYEAAARDPDGNVVEIMA